MNEEIRHMNTGMLRLEDPAGVWPTLMMVSGYAAMERDSETIEVIDLVKAIYIVDLEHVARFWDDWEQFEELVSNQRLGNGMNKIYINRTLYLQNLQLSVRESDPGKSQIMILGSPSPKYLEIINTARAIASKREGAAAPFTTRDLLFSICSQDHDMLVALQKSGLQLKKLEAAVNKLA